MKLIRLIITCHILLEVTSHPSFLFLSSLPSITPTLRYQMRYTLQSSEIFMVTSSRNVQLSLMQLFVECKGITWQACNMFVSFQFLIEEK
jgi:hypothetical protein